MAMTCALRVETVQQRRKLKENLSDASTASLDSPSFRRFSDATTVTFQRQRSDDECTATTSIGGLTDYYDLEVVTLSRAQVLQLAAELLENFEDAAFQQQLKQLRDQAGVKGVGGSVQGLSELALSVQRRIVPKYGFPGTPKGIGAMLMAVEPFLGDWMVGHLIGAIDEKLGLPAGWTNSQCRSLAQVRTRKSLVEALASRQAGDEQELTRAEALALAVDLEEAVTEARARGQLHCGLAGGAGDAAAVLARFEMAFAENSAVFAKHGFVADDPSVSVAAALRALAAHAGDWTVRSKMGDVDRALGLDAGALFDSLFELSQ